MIKQIGTPIKIKIAKGDSLSKIAKANNTTIDAIKALNPQIKDINKIKIGDEVILSAPPKKVEEKATNPFNQSFHVIQKGDNPTLIARKYKMSLKDFMELNPKLNSKKLFVGQRLYLRKEAAKTDLDFGKLTTVPKAEAKKTQNLPKLLNDELLAKHIIKSGDSIEKLARRYTSDSRITLNQRKQQILEANNLTSKSVLKVGQEINIPNYKYIPKINPVDATDEKFAKDIKFIFSADGGLNSKTKNVDRGGLTNLGITQQIYNRYQRDKAIDANIDKPSSYKSVANITKEEAKEIYYNYYYKESGADKIKDDKLRLAYLDTAVNCGQKTATEFLETSKNDVNKFYNLRKEYYQKIVKNDSSQRRFLKGWLNRIERLKNNKIGEA